MTLRIPDLHGDVHVAETADQLYDELAALLLATSIRAVERTGVFHLALSGGSTPEPFYVRLVIDPRYRAIPWAQTHIWIVDERQVPLDDRQSNFRLIRESLTDHVPARRRNVHALDTAAPDAAERYQAALRRALGDDGRLDFVLLGMGTDAHTASLFPHSPALRATDRWVVRNEGEKVTPPPRLTMTYPLLNRAHQVAVLVTGSQKRDTIQRLEAARAAGNVPVEEYPIAGVMPTAGDLMWFLDGEACGDGA